MNKSIVGIMADSHGQTESIITALRVLTDMGCRPIYHLGDVCDSAHPETVEACLNPLRDHGVSIIKGNNDHTIVANHLGREKPPVSPEILDYLKNLPLVKFHQNAILAHSLPFAREMGLSSMIGYLGECETRRFFNEFPGLNMFRGHGHSPEIVWRQGEHLARRSLVGGGKFDLTENTPCVVTCGALSQGFCMTWSPDENVIECLSFQ